MGTSGSSGGYTAEAHPAGAAQLAGHRQRGTAGAAPVLAPSSPSVRSIPEALPTRFCVSDAVLCTARWDGNRSVEGDEECSCIRPDCVVESSTVSSGGCWTSNSSHLLDGFWGQRWQYLVGLTDLLCFSARTCWFFAGFNNRCGSRYAAHAHTLFSFAREHASRKRHPCFLTSKTTRKH